MGGGGVMPGSLPKEVASVAHKMQHGSFLTPRLRGKFNTVEEVFLALSSGKNRSWNFAPKWCLRTQSVLSRIFIVMAAPYVGLSICYRHGNLQLSNTGRRDDGQWLCVTPERSLDYIPGSPAFCNNT